MSEFQEFRSDRLPAQNKRASGVWSLAALSFAACLCSVLGAKLLSQSLDGGKLVVAASHENSILRQLADSAPKAARSVTVVRRLGVDGVTTATIPNKFPLAPQSLTPCGDETGK